MRRGRDYPIQGGEDFTRAGWLAVMTPLPNAWRGRGRISTIDGGATFLHHLDVLKAFPIY